LFILDDGKEEGLENTEFYGTTFFVHPKRYGYGTSIQNKFIQPVLDSKFPIRRGGGR